MVILRRKSINENVVVEEQEDSIQELKDKDNYWPDKVLQKIEPEIETIQNIYNLSLERLSDNSTLGDTLYNNLLEVIQDKPQSFDLLSDNTEDTDIIYFGSYLDKSFIDHLLELHLSRGRGDKFTLWIRPDLKSASITKFDNAIDLSQFKNWVENNVVERKKQQNANSYKTAILSELKNLGGEDSSISGMVDFHIQNLNKITIDVNTKEDTVRVDVSKGGKNIDSFMLNYRPFEEPPIKVAKIILDRIKNIKKESIIYTNSVSDLYDLILYKGLEKEGIRRDISYNKVSLVFCNKRCILESNDLCKINLYSTQNTPIVEYRLSGDIRYIQQDIEGIKNILEINRNKM